MSMLESAKEVLAVRIEQMGEEALLALLEETFPYVRCTTAAHLSSPVTHSRPPEGTAAVMRHIAKLHLTRATFAAQDCRPEVAVHQSFFMSWAHGVRLMRCQLAPGGSMHAAHPVHQHIRTSLLLIYHEHLQLQH